MNEKIRKLYGIACLVLFGLSAVAVLFEFVVDSTQFLSVQNQWLGDLLFSCWLGCLAAVFVNSVNNGRSSRSHIVGCCLSVGVILYTILLGVPGLYGGFMRISSICAIFFTVQFFVWMLAFAAEMVGYVQYKKRIQLKELDHE